MADRLFRQARLADGRCVDLGVRDGRFVEASEIADARDVVDLGGLLVVSGFVDGHIHLDKSFLGGRWRPHERAGSLRERLAIEKRLLGEARPVRERAEALIAQARSFGTIAMRSHVDVDAATGLDHFHAVLEAREAWKDRMAIELVAFPQAGIVTSPGTADLLEAAVREGAEVIGGIDPTTLDGDADAHLDVVFGIAERHGVKIDIHLHEHGTGGIEQIERIAGRTATAGLGGRVTISHAYALGDVPPDEARRTADILARAGVSILTNAPGDHPFPPVAVLRDAGVHVFAGNDNIRDAWWPYGNGDMLQRAMLIGYRSGFYTDDDLHFLLDMATRASAGALGLEDYGIAAGNEATFVILDAPNAAAAVAMPAADPILVQRGEFASGTSASLNRKLKA